MDRQTFTIGCLGLSATLLGIGILVVGALQTRQAEASDMLATVGTVTLFTGALDTARDQVYVIDTATEKLAIYRLRETNKVLELIDVLALDDAGGQDKKPPALRP